MAPFVKTSLGPGSRVVTDYLEATDLQKELDQLGFQTVGYGCTTCIGNSGPLHPAIEGAITEGNLVVASVLSGNRNFEARIHGNIKSNFLMSPPLVVAYALAGRVDIDLVAEPLGNDSAGDPVFLKDLWPTQAEVKEQLASALKPEVYKNLYGDLDNANPKWGEIKGKGGATYAWDESSTYVQLPPFFEGYDGTMADMKDILDARPMGIFGDSVTTDHISPAGAIKEDSPAGQYLLSKGVEKASFNSYGSRRGNDRIMTRGTFANVRIKNLMVPGTEGGYTTYFGKEAVTNLELPKTTQDGVTTHIHDACMAYEKEGTNLIVIGGEDYGMGSSRDWAAKGTRLLGVQSGSHQKLRAHSSLQPYRDGRPPPHLRQSRRLRRSGPHARLHLQHHRSQQRHQAPRRSHPQDQLRKRIPPRRPPRYPRRNRLLPCGWNFALCSHPNPRSLNYQPPTRLPAGTHRQGVRRTIFRSALRKL